MSRPIGVLLYVAVIAIMITHVEGMFSGSMEKKMSLPTFSGQEKDFQVWWMRFKAYATLAGFAVAITRTRPDDLPTSEDEELDSDDDDEARQEIVRKANTHAMASLTMAFTTETLMELIVASMTEEWPGGLAFRVIDALFNLHRPMDVMSKVELRRELIEVKMKKDQDPRDLFAKITAIKNKYGAASLSKDEIISYVLEAAPKDYVPALVSEARMKGNAIQVADFENVMREQWRIMYPGGAKKVTTTPELALLQAEGKKDKTCYRCHKKGHMAFECPEGKKGGEGNKNKNKNKKCNTCGKTGHLAADCWQDPKNADKVPEWLKKRQAKKKEKEADGEVAGIEVLLLQFEEEYESDDDDDVPPLLSQRQGAYDESSDEDDDDEMPSLRTRPIPVERNWMIGASDDDSSDEESITDSEEEQEDPGDLHAELVLAAITFPEHHKMMDNPNLWIADTGASSDSTPHETNMIEMKDIVGAKIKMTGANGKQNKIRKTGIVKGTAYDKFGTAQHDVSMDNVKFVPGNKFNLLSITKRLKSGWQLKGDAAGLEITKDGVTLKFDIKIHAGEGTIFGVYIHPPSTGADVAVAEAEIPRKINPIKAHDLFGHMSEAKTRLSAKQLGYEITRGKMTCESCPAGKARQKNVPKESSGEPATKPGQKVYLDVFSVKGEKDGPAVNAKRHGRMLVDDRSDMGFLKFFETKDGMVEPTLEQWNKWKKAGNEVKIVRLDNAGENKTLQKRAQSSDWKMNIDFQFTARNSPQMNSKAEVRIATVSSQGRAMMHRANMPKKERYRVFHKAFETANLLRNLDVITVDGVTQTRYEHFNGKLPKFTSNLRTWGEAGVVTNKKKVIPKLADRGVTCMFVAYSLDHAGDVYEMWDPVANVIYVTRDILWMHRLYFVNALQRDDANLLLGINDNDDNGSVSSASEGESDDDSETEKAPETRRSQRVIRPKVRYEPGTGGMERKVGEEWSSESDDDDDNEEEISAYQTALIQLTPAEEKFYSSMKEMNELGLMAMDYADPEPDEETALFGAALGGGFKNTNELKVLKYDEAMASADSEDWQEAVDEEHRKFSAYKIWKPVPKTEVPQGAKILTSTWAMKKKANGTFRARLNGRGFEQVKGVHYNENDIASPVVHDITVRIVLTLMIMAAYFGSLLDVSGAFLNGRFENGEELYMGVPKGFEKFYPSNVFLLLLRTIYGTKQAAIQYWKESLRAFTYLEYERSKADPCLQFKWINDKICIWLTWVDDNLVVGEETTVKEEKEKFKKLFECEDTGELKEYVGCKVEYNREERTIRLTQPVMIQSFQDEFDLPSGGPEPKIPAEAGSVLTGGEKTPERNHLPRERQTHYRAAVGKLLHMMRWTRPEIMNSVRECSRYMTGAAEAHLLAAKRIMRYVVATDKRGLTLKPEGIWDGSKDFLFDIEGWSDSEFAKDASRRSINGWSTFLNKSPVSYRSKMMPIVALSVTEAELYSAVLCAQDMLYEMRILNSMGLKVRLPMKLFIDNSGAHDICHNWSCGGRTRHVEVKQYFLRELKEGGLIDVVYVKGEKQRSDIFTKNLPRPTFEEHARWYVGRDEYMRDVNEVDASEKKMSPVSEQGRVSDGARTTGTTNG